MTFPDSAAIHRRSALTNLRLWGIDQRAENRVANDA
jgi:hypothetical protein